MTPEQTVLSILGDGAVPEDVLLSALEEHLEAAGPVDLAVLPGVLWSMVEAGTLRATFPEGTRDRLTEPMLYARAG